MEYYFGAWLISAPIIFLIMLSDMKRFLRTLDKKAILTNEDALFCVWFSIALGSLTVLGIAFALILWAWGLRPPSFNRFLKQPSIFNDAD